MRSYFQTVLSLTEGKSPFYHSPLRGKGAAFSYCKSGVEARSSAGCRTRPLRKEKNTACLSNISPISFFPRFYSLSSTSHEVWQREIVAGWTQDKGLPSRITTVLLHWRCGALPLPESCCVLNRRVLVFCSGKCLFITSRNSP
jgi:hypothetical protein